MSRKKKIPWMPVIFSILIIPFLAVPLPSAAADLKEGETVLVGRISHIEGRLLRYEPDEADWEATVKDTPFGMNDALYSENDSKAEIIMPNNTMVRIGADTQIQLIAIKENITEIEVVSGQARFYSKGSDVSIKARTPFGHVMGPAETRFDVFVDDETVKVTALKGDVFYVDNKSRGKFEVIAGSSSVVASSHHVTAGEADVDPYWDSWNADRDALWAQRMRIGGNSARYLPPELHGYAYVLEGCGRWERVFYDDAHYYFWRPIRVSVGWTPFSGGRWSVWYGEHTWIPYEPFGYVTHHYGNWVFISGIWYWMPPLAHVKVYSGHTLFNYIGFSWYPGRVAWIHHGAHIGWVPLAPHEPYYCYRRWGRRSIVIKNVKIIKYNTNRYRYAKHAVIIDRNNLYKVKNYQSVRVRNIETRNIAERYQAAPVIDKTALKGHRKTGKKYDLTHDSSIRKSFRSEDNGGQQRRSGVKENRMVKAKRAREKMTTIHRNRVAKKAEVNRQGAKNSVATERRHNRSSLQGLRIQKHRQNDTEDQHVRGRKQMGQNGRPHALRQIQKTERPNIDPKTNIGQRHLKQNLHVPNRDMFSGSRYPAVRNRGR